MSFFPGDTIRFDVAITDGATGAAADPSSVVVKVKSPATGTTTNHTATRLATGSYRADIVASLPGTWRYRIEATGTANCATEGAYVVHASRV